MMLRHIFHQFSNIIFIGLWVNLLSILYFEFLYFYKTQDIAIKYICFNNFVQNLFCAFGIQQKMITSHKYTITNNVIFAIIACNHDLFISHPGQDNLLLSMILYVSFKTLLVMLQYLSLVEFRSHPFVNHFYYNTFYMLYLTSFTAELSFLVYASFIIQNFYIPFVLVIIYYTYVFVNIQSPATLQIFFFKKHKFYKNLKKKPF